MFTNNLNGKVLPENEPFLWRPHSVSKGFSNWMPDLFALYYREGRKMPCTFETFLSERSTLRTNEVASECRKSKLVLICRVKFLNFIPVVLPLPSLPRFRFLMRVLRRSTPAQSYHKIGLGEIKHPLNEG